MAEDFELHKMDDGRVLVILHPSCKISREAILALLAELGIDNAAVVFLLPEEVASYGDLADAPVLIPIDKTSCDEPEIDAVGRLCGQAGGRVIILFGEGFPYEGLHQVADKYGTQCGWSVAHLDTCLKSPALTPPRNSGGEAVIRPKSSQVIC